MSLQVWLPLKGNLENLGLAEVTVTNNGAVVDTGGKIGSCYSFDGSSSWIKISMPTDFTTIKNKSIAAWVYSASTSGAVGGMSHDGGATSAMFTAYFNSGWQFGDGSGYKYVSGGTVANTSTWHHVACTIDDTTVTSYLDGTKVTSVLLTNLGNGALTDLNASIENFIEIGCDHPGGNEFFNGKINDFRIYDHCLSAKEVKLISQALVCHYPLNDFVGGENLIKGTSPEELSFTIPSTGVSDRFTAKTVEVPSGTTYTLSFLAKADVDGAVLRTHYYNPNTTTTCVSSQGRTKTASDGNMDFILTTKWEHYWVRYSQSSTTAIKTIICPRLMGTDYISTQKSGKIYWKMVKFEEGSVATPWVPNASDTLYSAMGFDGDTVYDCSGYGNHGVMASSGVSAGEGSIRYSSCMQFDKGSATSGYIDAGTGGKVTDEITVSTWMYMDTWTTNQHPFSCTEGGGWNIETQSSMPSFQVYVRTVGYKHSVKSGVTPKWTDLSSGWHLFTGTYDGYTVTLYIDGQPAGSNTTGSTSKLPIQYHTSNHIYLHSEATGSGPSGSYDACKMSDFRIYATALSAADVKELYETSASVDNHGNMYAYEFNEL